MLDTLRKCMELLDPPMRLRWFALVVLAALAAVLELSGTAVVFGLINLADDSAAAANAPLVGKYLALAVDRYGTDAIIVLGIFAAVYFVAKNGFLLFEIYYRERTAAYASAILGAKLMRAYLAAPYSFHFRRNSAITIRDLENSVDVVFRTVLLSATIAMSEFFILLGVASVLLAVEPLVALTSGVVIVGMGIGIVTTMRAWAINLGERINRVAGTIIQAIQQGLGSIKETKILGRERFFLDRFREGRNLRARLACQYATVAATPRLAVESVMVVGMILVIVLLLARQGSNSTILPIIGLFAYAGFRIVPSVNRIIMHINNVRFGKAAVDSVYEGHRAALEGRLADESPGNEPIVGAVTFNRELRMEGVTYRYPGADRDALTDATLVIPRGLSVGIVGATGAGKTTLVDVLLGLLHPQRGRLLVDGRDVTDDPRPWQRMIGYVPQSIYLTDDTIAANIALGIPPAEIDATAVRRAAGMAQILGFIEDLPEKFDTVVGERGIRLSGGQRQRIGIARALYHDPDLLVFDEATSALDNETEAELSHAIARLSGVKTVVLIAHRFSTLHSCGALVMMKDGRIVAEGSYDELMRVSDDFRRLAALADRTLIDRARLSPTGTE